MSKGVGDLDAVLLAVLLMQQRNITSTKLQCNRLSGLAAAALAKVVENIPTFEYVSGMPVRQMLSQEIQHLMDPGSTFQSTKGLDALTCRRVDASTHRRIDALMRQRVFASKRRWVDASTCRRIHASTCRRVDASTRRCVDASTR